ncbi:hypothetical protein ACGFI3_29920 [Nonomuraea wenchangensis]|uniref:hypothetical protein n=1 Tax=Nonomuraea wenchangensis TaxID=568860 RepID=UPI003718E8B2
MPPERPCHRRGCWAILQTAWRNHYNSATEEIDILAYSAHFLRAKTGVNVRILGDPESRVVAARGVEEGIGAEVTAARVKNALALHRPLLGVHGVEIRLHRTVLYNSLYRADDQILINTHAYGTPAANAPVMHLTHTNDEGPASTYLSSFNRIWTTAQPHNQ